MIVLKSGLWVNKFIVFIVLKFSKWKWIPACLFIIMVNKSGFVFFADDRVLTFN